MSRENGGIPSQRRSKTTGQYPNSENTSPDREEVVSLGDSVVKLEMRTKVEYSKLPWGVWAMEKLGLCCFHPTLL